MHPINTSMCLQVLDTWSLDKKLRFVAFVTGGQRPCPMGPEVLNIVLSFVPQQYRDQASMLQRLPMVSPPLCLKPLGKSTHILG